jgi:ABC-2 type transport system ATP-binding protein
MTTAQSTPDPLTGGRDVPALLLSGLTKSFGDTAAVGDVELTVASGTFLGLVGPNGAGKTTLMGSRCRSG